MLQVVEDLLVHGVLPGDGPADLVEEPDAGLLEADVQGLLLGAPLRALLPLESKQGHGESLNGGRENAERQRETFLPGAGIPADAEC